MRYCDPIQDFLISFRACLGEYPDFDSIDIFVNAKGAKGLTKGAKVFDRLLW
jgi:hypothetical protein